MMKTFLMLCLVIIGSGGTAALAEPVRLSPESIDVLSVITANAGAVAELSKHGNRLTEATTEQVSPETTRFTITIQQCWLSGCIGGATLVIDRMNDFTPGKFPPFRYKVEMYQVK